jgi:hypothetical protein
MLLDASTASLPIPAFCLRKIKTPFTKEKSNGQALSQDVGQQVGQRPPGKHQCHQGSNPRLPMSVSIVLNMNVYYDLHRSTTFRSTLIYWPVLSSIRPALMVFPQRGFVFGFGPTDEASKTDIGIAAIISPGPE